MTIRRIPILLAAASLAVAGYAAAQPYDSYGPNDDVVVTGPAPSGDREIKSEVVSYADLDIDAPAGVHTLLRRIRGAAQQVCSPEPIALELRDNADYRDCKDEAMDRAVDQLDAPLVSDTYHAGDW